MNEQAALYFSDDVLRFLYSSPMFQQVEEREQQLFLSTFRQQQAVHELLQLACTIDASLAELEYVTPAIWPIEQSLPIRMMDRIKQHENVYYMPYCTPLPPSVIVLEQPATQQEMIYLAATIVMPLLQRCAVECRDVVIIPFSDTCQQPIVFSKGQLHVAPFQQLLATVAPTRAELACAVKLIEEQLADVEELAVWLVTKQIATPIERVSIVARLKALPIALHLVLPDEAFDSFEVIDL